LAGLILTGVLSHLVHTGKVHDAAALTTFSKLRDTRLDGLLSTVIHIADTLPYLLLSAAVVATAILRARPRTAAACGVVLLCAPVSAQAIKYVTAQARANSLTIHNHIANASWPSGHSCGAMALALCAVLVAPPVWRPLVALAGGLLAIAVGYSVVALVWHFPSDAIGGFLLAATWTLGAVAVLRRHPDRVAVEEAEAAAARPGSRSEVGPVLGGGIAVLLFAAGGALVLASMRGEAGKLVDHGSALAAAVVIAVLGALLSAVLVLSARSA
jgi:membrane-associated phospholipid phosphatase